MLGLPLKEILLFFGTAFITFKTARLYRIDLSVEVTTDWSTKPAEATTSTNSINETDTAISSTGGVRHHRRKRFDYEDNYEWDDDDDLTYEDYYEEKEEPSFFHKLATHWRTAGPRMVCLGAFLLLVTIVLCGCLRLACRFWCKSMEETSGCCFMPGVKNMCQHCYTDPMYEKVKELGEMMGIEITFTTYEMIKEQYCPDDAPMGLFG